MARIPPHPRRQTHTAEIRQTGGPTRNLMPRIRTIRPEFWPRENDVWGGGSCVYVLEEEASGFIKVGICIHPTRRVSALQVGNPRKLKLLALYGGIRRDCLAVERETLHNFRVDALRGEWVSTPKKAVLRFIAGFIEQGDAQ